MWQRRKGYEGGMDVSGMYERNRVGWGRLELSGIGLEEVAGIRGVAGDRVDAACHYV